MKENSIIGILGSGSWATALAKIVLSSHKNINWLFRKPEQIAQFKKLGHNPSYLQAAEFDTNCIEFYTESDINKFIKNSNTIILATPSPYLKNYLKKIRSSNFKDKFVVNAIKGIIPDENILISDFLMNEFSIPRDYIGMIGGPCNAEEVARHRKSYLTVACSSIKNAETFAEVLRNDFVSCVTTKDVEGVQYSSVLKNIYSIAAGICNGLQYGDNFQSVLMSNAIAEMNSFVNTIHLIERNITDSVYLGDLLVTAYSQHSRNRTFGNMIGKGYSVKAAQAEMEMVAEGYYGARCIHNINKHYQVNMPISEMIYKILYKKEDPASAILELTKHFR